MYELYQKNMVFFTIIIIFLLSSIIYLKSWNVYYNKIQMQPGKNIYIPL